MERMRESRMTPECLAVLVASGESETLESKATTETRREAVMTGCVFLNQRRGQVLLKALLHKLITGEIRIADLDLSAFIHRNDRLGDI